MKLRLPCWFESHIYVLPSSVLSFLKYVLCTDCAQVLRWPLATHSKVKKSILCHRDTNNLAEGTEGIQITSVSTHGSYNNAKRQEGGTVSAEGM